MHVEHLVTTDERQSQQANHRPDKSHLSFFHTAAKVIKKPELRNSFAFEKKSKSTYIPYFVTFRTVVHQIQPPKKMISPERERKTGLLGDAQTAEGSQVFAPHALKGQKLLAQGVALGCLGR